MTDTPMGADHDPVEPTQPEPTQPEPTQPEQLEPPVAATRPTDMPPQPAATAEIPTVAAPPAATAPATPTSPPARRKGVMVPWWALAVVAALVVFSGGYLIGHAVGDDGHDGRRSTRFVGPGGGRPGPGEMPNPFGGNGNRNGNGTNPFGGNGPFSGNGGNGSGNGNGNGGGGTSPTARSQAFLGVGVADVANGGGARISTVVSSGPAADAGLTQGDVVTAIDGTKVTDITTLRSAIADHQPGDDVKVTYTHAGAPKTATVTLGDRNSTSQ
jgi:membrane-associated protease RseP (regulator of RpoE activity)